MDAALWYLRANRARHANATRRGWRALRSRAMNPGIPAFIFRNHFEIGFRSGYTERRVRAMLQGQRASGSEPVDAIELPILGVVQTAGYSLPALTLTIGLIVLIYTVTLHRLALTERGAKVLEGISGVLLIGFGLVFLVKPELLA